MVVVKTKRATATDRHAGARVRMRRMMLGMSQEKLGHALGVSFQQVQKYEKGENRMGASRLQQVAQVFEVPVSFFFEGAPPPDNKSGHQVHPAATLSDEETQVIVALREVKNKDDRKRVVKTIRSICEIFSS